MLPVLHLFPPSHSSDPLNPCSSPPLYIKSHHIPSPLHHSTPTPLLLLLLCLQARMPSRRSGLSPGTSLWGWEPQLCWGVRCCGPRGLCSGWKMASSWDLREACQVFNATAWLETPREVNRDTRGIRSPAYWALMDLFELHRWTRLIKASPKRHCNLFSWIAHGWMRRLTVWQKNTKNLVKTINSVQQEMQLSREILFLNCLRGKMNNCDV